MGYFLNSADEAETAFYSAFNHLDMDLMRATWHEGDDVACIHPGGPLQSGFETVMRHWQYILKDSQPPRLSYKVLKAVDHGDIAVHLVEETIGSGPDAAVVLATNVYVKADQGWRLLSHHASVPPDRVWTESVPAAVH